MLTHTPGITYECSNFEGLGTIYLCAEVDWSKTEKMITSTEAMTGNLLHGSSVCAP